MTITLDLPEPLARQLLAMPEPERNRFAIARLADDADEETPFAVDFHDYAPVSLADLSPADRESVLAGLADADAGRETPFFEALAGIEADLKAGRLNVPA